MQALGNPNDLAAAFAQDFLGSVMSGLPMPQARPAAARDAREATLALLDETFGNTARDPREALLLAAGPDAGVWTESLSRSFDFGRGYVEGSGMSLLQTGEAIAAVARNPGQFIDGVRALITSSQARQQLGEAIINRINYDLREFNHAYNTGGRRRAGVGQRRAGRRQRRCAPGRKRAGGAGGCRCQCKTGDGTVAADWGGAGYLLRRKLMKLLPDMVILEHDSHMFLRILNIY